MSDYSNEAGLFVASRGEAATHGLYFFAQSGDRWSGTQLAQANQLAALCWHPTLPVVYGLSGLGAGLLHAWNVSGVGGGAATALATIDSGGEIPCDVAVDPSGRMLVAANFGTDEGGGTLSVWSLDDDGIPVEPVRSVALGLGSGVRGAGQGRSHPHQIVFRGGRMYVPDYGADRVRVFDVDAAAAVIHETDPLIAPDGSAPRHMAFVGGDDRFVASAELSGVMLAADLEGTWTSAPGTHRTEPVTGRHAINYPGDVKVRGTVAYFANRGYDTIATFAVDTSPPRMIAEVESGVRWAQHLLVQPEHLLVAGWDSDTVSVMRIIDGVPGPASTLFECAGAGWLLDGKQGSYL